MLLIAASQSFALELGGGKTKHVEGGGYEEPDTELISLKNVALQRNFWDHIVEKIQSLNPSDPKEAWVPIVNQFRKLREGVYASRWSQGEWIFALNVYEQSVLCCLKAGDEDELHKSIRGLVEELYTLQPSLEDSYYTALYAIYLSFRDSAAAKDRMTRLKKDTHEYGFSRHVVYSVLSKNPIKFFSLYRHAPDPYFQLMMDNHVMTMRRHAIQVMRAAYYSMSLEWASKWLGLAVEDVPAMLEQLTQPNYIRIDPEQQIDNVEDDSLLCTTEVLRKDSFQPDWHHDLQVLMFVLGKD
ncbi:hypothetical protein EC973_005743 [Apophysomyces ossiformis]|uniref:PCI domain-containing protein n=1 Tax=Apophysomyces ossiformis TaxID=679940 RepID=A0A8H7EKY0_9FUNG|nr:hypothetical protein EC973_005743 [Apophysomyces ossiformis]